MDRGTNAPARPVTLAVVGGGWAGLAAAVRATQAGAKVTLFEMAGHLGGRARGVDVGTLSLDNGQHILIGAYSRTLDLMRSVGVDPEQLLWRQPLELRYPDGRGLRLPLGHPVLAFVRAVAACKGWTWRDRSSLLTAAGHWAAAGFTCDPRLTVAELCKKLTPPVRALLIDPLCVAALNTPAAEASASVLLTVLRDALFSGRGSADMLLPRRPLDALLPHPAHAWLQARGVPIHFSHRVQKLSPVPAPGTGWKVDNKAFDQLVLACPAAEAARLVAPLEGSFPGAVAWAAQAQSLRYEPIITVYVQCHGARLPAPLMALQEGPQAPAQFVLDHGALGSNKGVFGFVVSGAQPWVDAGLPATAAAVLAQARSAFSPGTWPTAPTLLRVLSEKRATFRCTPALDRPGLAVGPGLWAAGDYVRGPYPATLEGAVRSAEAAVTAAVTAALTAAADLASGLTAGLPAAAIAGSPVPPG